VKVHTAGVPQVNGLYQFAAKESLNYAAAVSSLANGLESLKNGLFLKILGL
jgi:hypothetical protein